ncbi:TetR/AcrR family transcriptional regulator [Homoserinibacter sp. GY 40078]|uniref:TetR/AcrR family transcriptional regulator n=1 Tax=Homoserinibacter sp. GY 40078 TaxID=2603275 RepID=UPI0011CC2C39|nr:TetR/AcrR family transcriptional regulator [Homoserinibacter sp. GY 40078]TXK17118.1 TetR/AcrR family transcriptional regulator [Homoserinibacter sp. GY 40078]
MQPTIPTSDRILDAAAEILISDGVDTLTHGSIASRTGIARAVVEDQHPTLESVFEALLAREMLEAVTSVSDNVERDPRGGLASRIFSYVICGIYERPLLRALHLMAPGGIAQIVSALDGMGSIPELSIHPQLLPALQHAGMVREDVDAEAVVALVRSLGYGVSLTAPWAGLDEVCSALAMLLERGVDADVTDTSPGKEVFRRFAESLVAGALPR